MKPSLAKSLTAVIASAGLVAAAAQPSSEVFRTLTRIDSHQDLSTALGVLSAARSVETAAALHEPSALSMQLTLDAVSGYYYRGIIQEDTGLILQPGAKLTARLLKTDRSSLDAFVGTWNSFHGQKTGSSVRGDIGEHWYESDFFAGVTFTEDWLSITATYTFLASPNDAFETVQELGFTVAVDDSQWLTQWALKPYATFAIETGADASDGADSDTGMYLELGIGPGFTFDAGRTPIAVTFPASVGFSLSDYYQNADGDDDRFGFAQVGAKASIPLGTAGRYGSWTLNAGVSVLLLGDHTSDYNDGDETDVIGTIGLQWNF